jgi:hypothetical protein
MKVVVLGGYGNFGARICRALAGNPGIELVVAGRNIDKARALAQQLGAQAAALDGADPRLADALRESGVGLVIHTAGPFQGQDYHVASSAARAGCHYIDLADGRRFVCDFGSRVGDAFKSAGSSGISGASTVPALAMLAAPRRSGVAAPERLAALLHRCGSWVDWLGTPDGGMVVRLRGRGLNGEPLGLAWEITAPNHHGPEIPCMAAIVLARRLAGGATLPVGAMPCMGLISLQDFTPEFERWGMHTSWTAEVAT